MLKRRRHRALTACLLAALLVFGAKVARADPPAGVGISYAYYDPLSLVLKEKSFLQDALGSAVRIDWVLSQGSIKALEFLRGNSIQSARRPAPPRCSAAPT